MTFSETDVSFATLIAIDWSGSQKDAVQRQKIWACKVGIEQGSIVVDVLESGRTRNEIVAWLGSLRGDGTRVVVGLDFAFSFPAGFHGHEGATARLSGESWSEFLTYAREYGDEILETCPAPFWGHAGRRRLSDATFSKYSDGERLRLTEKTSVGKSGGPKEVFQIGGAGSVGAGSLRGMQILSKLRASGWSIWPFDEPTAATVVEIYPGCLYEWKVKKSDVLDRERYLKRMEQSRGGITNPADRWLWARAMATDDAFDAFVSCIAMARAELEGGLLASYQGPKPAGIDVEGWIWGGESW